jgi:large subunit ribosomal protein L6
MSRIGQKPIEIPKGITVTVSGATVTGKGPGGELAIPIPACIEANVSEGKVTLSVRDPADARAGAMHGTARTLVANMVSGVQKPYTKDLEIQGVGFKAQQQGANKLVLSLGYSHPIEFEIPKGITVKVTDGTAVSVSGADKQMVGQVSSRIRGYFPAEPYKGKGVRYKGEHIRRKAGKAVA